jgi:hypothetical protein
MGRMRNIHRTVVANLKGREHMKDLGVGGSMLIFY